MGRACPELVEINGVVYLKCGNCGQLHRTRLKPMSAYMPRSAAVERGLLEK
jgi:hypothetical protein